MHPNATTVSQTAEANVTASKDEGDLVHTPNTDMLDENTVLGDDETQVRRASSSW